MNEVNEAAKVITSSADEDAKIIFGAIIDESLKDKVKVTVVATSFGNGPRHDKAGAKMKFTSPSSFAQPVAAVKKESIFKQRVSKFEDEIKKKEAISRKTKEAEELDIPAFIRKKMM
jgi:cell division protein FtsZ